jgi:hypothetical protein
MQAFHVITNDVANWKVVAGVCRREGRGGWDAGLDFALGMGTSRAGPKQDTDELIIENNNLIAFISVQIF